MSARSDCPSHNSLRDLAAGALPAELADIVRTHLTLCDDCRQSFNQLLNSLDTVPASDPRDQPTRATPPVSDEEDGFELDTNTSFSFLNPSSNPDALGRLGSCDILKLEGRGGMGIVFKAFDTSLHRTVAIKVLSPHLATSRKAHRRFLREARAAAGINHPNVVTIHAVDESNEMPYVVMEFVAGRTLHDRIRSTAPLDLASLLRIAAQIASGLAAAHEHGVVHRDIKPANILLEDGIERVKITDFGLALVAMDATNLTSAERVVGTPSYMSPEQVQGTAVDARSDLFSFGCVLYAMVLGRSPFHGSHALEVAKKVTEQGPDLSHPQFRQVPQYLVDIIVRLLEKKPEQRFQTAAEVRDLLLRYLSMANQNGSNPQAEPTILYRPPRLRRHWRRMPATVALATVATLGFAGSSYWWLPRPYREMEPDKTEQREPRELAVAKDGKASFQSINAALAAAIPGDTIRVLDNATYFEELEINNPGRWRGITLIAERRAAIDSRKGGNFATITIENTPGVTLRGFRVVTPAKRHGLLIAGAAEGVTIEDVIWEQNSESTWANLLVGKNAAGTPEKPIRIVRCQIQTAWIGVCVGSDNCRRVSHCRIEDCRFTGDKFHNLKVDRPVRDLMVRGNLFVGSGVLLEKLDGDEQISTSQLHVINNSFFRAQQWLQVEGCTQAQGVHICNNLILESDALICHGQAFSELADRWTFQKNWWEPTEKTKSEDAELVADLQSKISVISRDSTDPRFLTLPTDSPLGIQGLGGEFPKYIGAFDPAAKAAPSGQ